MNKNSDNNNSNNEKKARGGHAYSHIIYSIQMHTAHTNATCIAARTIPFSHRQMIECVEKKKELFFVARCIFMLLGMHKIFFGR